MGQLFDAGLDKVGCRSERCMLAATFVFGVLAPEGLEGAASGMRFSSEKSALVDMA